MRIFYDYQAFNIQRRGGISRYILETAERVANFSGCEAKVFAFAHINLSLAENTKVRSVGHLVNDRFFHTRARTQLDQMLTRRELQQFRPDIVHETYYSERGLVGSKSKTVVTVHDMIHEKFLANRKDVAPTVAAKRTSVLRADHVICVSENTKSDLLDLIPVSSEKVSVVHLGSSFNLVSEAEAGILRGGSGRRPYLLYVGDRSNYKNFYGLLTAYCQSKLLHKNFDLVCFGSHAFTMNESFAISQTGLPAGTVRHECGDDSALKRAYIMASAFVYPSLYEGFGLPPLEAMACRCPVICFSVGSIPEVAGSAAAFCEDESSDALQLAIEAVVSDDKLRSRLIETGAERVGHFSWDRCARETLEVYKNIAKRTRIL